jgi:hypothetical protein
MWTYVLGPLLVLLPPRWRSAWFGHLPVNWAQAAAVSGVVEAVGCLAGLIAWYFVWLHASVAQQIDVTLKATKGVPGHGAGVGMGAIALLTFVTHPGTWTLVYFSIEGVARALAAILGEQPLGTLPLAVVDRIVARSQRRRAEARVPLVPDKVTRSDAAQPWDLRVESCRPKPTWKPPLAVRFEDRLYKVLGQAPEAVNSPRPYIYILQRIPAGEAARGPVNYDPQEALGPPEPGLLATALEAFREGFRVKSLPLVADSLREERQEEDALLHVESCRPKYEWTPGRVIHYADRYYRMECTYEAQRPRSFGFRLRQLPAGVPGRSVIVYDPADVLRKPK